MNTVYGSWLIDCAGKLGLRILQYCICDVEAGISQNYCATNLGSRELELRFCPWALLYVRIMCMHKAARSKVRLRWQDLRFNISYTERLKFPPQEKHMAPIDCSGVAPAAGHSWFCKFCRIKHKSKVRAILPNHMNSSASYSILDQRTA